MQSSLRHHIFLLVCRETDLTNGSGGRVHVESSGQLLRIHKLEMSDSGNYSCTAKNHFGVDEVTFQLEVKCELLRSNKKLLILREP